MDANNAPICRVVCFNESKIARLKDRLPEQGQLRDLAEQYKAVGHTGRLAILHVLAEEECCVCDLSSILGQPVSTVSQHLRTLKSAGLVRPRQEGKLVFYSLESPEFAGSIIECSMSKSQHGG